MSLLHYIDNEVPALGEWDSRTEVGSSTIDQSEAAAFPERGSLGLRCTIVGTDKAYVSKTVNASVSGGGECWLAFRFPVQTAPPGGWSGPLLLKNSGASWVGGLMLYSTGKLRLRIYSDAGAASYSGYGAVDLRTLDQPYVAIRLVRATTNVSSDGRMDLYLNGQPHLSITGIDNYDRYPALGSFDLGLPSGAQDGVQLDFDEIKIATTYPEPFVPTPLTDYPEARRIVVLYRQASADSVEFADYCVSELGVPRSNLCPLPNATANESLADYATFQTEVETDLAAWLALNPTVEANCSCFLIGYGVPGYFTSGGVKHSATSRLMNYGTAFSSQTTNPLYNPSTVARLTKTALGGKYLASRIDADTLANAKAVIDRSLVVAALSALPATDQLYSDETIYKASLACQHLRIITADPAETISHDAFAFGDCDPTYYGDAGSRAAFVDDTANSAYSLRSVGTECQKALANSYAAALGCSETSETFDAESFFEMLRIGGTLVEAFAVAISKLDYTAVAAGSPLMTVALQLGGYNVYRGFGGAEGIDWENPIAYLMPGQDNITLAQDLSPGQRYVYAVRSVSSAGIEERNTHVIAYAEPDEQGSLLPASLARPTDLTAGVQQNSLLIGFTYMTPIGFADADGFDVLSDNGTGQLDLENPVATVEKSRNDRFDFEVSIARPDTPVLLAVRARRGEQVGPVSEIVYVPLVSAPASIKIL